MTDPKPLTPQDEAIVRQAWNTPRSWPVPQLLAEIDWLRAILAAAREPAAHIAWLREDDRLARDVIGASNQRGWAVYRTEGGVSWVDRRDLAAAILAALEKQP